MKEGTYVNIGQGHTPFMFLMKVMVIIGK